MNSYYLWYFIIIQMCITNHYFKIRKLLNIILLAIFCSSCWAPRCPEQACHVKFEHLHEGAAYRGGSFLTAKKHAPWVKSNEYSMSKRKRKEEKTKKKPKKLFEWERE